MQASKFLFSIVFGLFITFGLLFGLAQASSQVMEPNLPTADIFYVDADAEGDATGLDWTNAYTTVQDALAVATDGDQVWVAEGVYYPDEGRTQTNDAVTSTFTLVSGVALYGGFDPDNDVEAFNDRDWEAYPTVLSGDIDHETLPDATDPRGVVTNTTDIEGNNAYHVILSLDVTNTTVIDGFTITAGNANVVHQRYGGGMYNTNQASPTLTNVIFSGNYALADGGGLCNGQFSDLTLTNVTFTGNYADAQGGGMVNYHSNPILTNVIFSGNSTGNRGAGLYNGDYASPVLINVIFSGNFANQQGQGGGGLFNNLSTPILYNVTFSGNFATGCGGGMHNERGKPVLINTILWGNEATTGSQICNSSNSEPVISFSNIQDSGGSGSGWDDTLGIDNGNNIDADPDFEQNPSPGPDGNWNGINDDYGDLHLRPGSLAIDNGTNEGCPTIDMDGGPRPINGICDMGAYEIGYALMISKTVDDATPEPGQTITFTIGVENHGLDVSDGMISDTLPSGLNFLGPITLEPEENGSLGSATPILVSDLTISYTNKVILTLPVTVSYGLAGGTQLTNTVTVSATEMLTPALASISVTIQNVAPVALDDGGSGFSTGKGAAFTTPNVLANDSDPNGDILTVSSLDTSSTQGMVTNNGDGTFSYDPNGQFDALGKEGQATDVFTYTVSDGHGSTDTAIVTITIQDMFSIYLPLVIR